MNSKYFTTIHLWDRLGIGISGICAIHCLLVPFVVSVLPVLPVAASIHSWVHPVFILLIFPTVWLAARRSHFDRKISLFLVLGLLLVMTGWPAGHVLGEHEVETIFTVAGSFLLIAGHAMNYRHHRQCNNSRHQHHPILEELTEKRKDETP